MGLVIYEFQHQMMELFIVRELMQRIIELFNGVLQRRMGSSLTNFSIKEWKGSSSCSRISFSISANFVLEELVDCVRYYCLCTRMQDDSAFESVYAFIEGRLLSPQLNS
jgi:hypothetical protein